MSAYHVYSVDVVDVERHFVARGRVAGGEGFAAADEGQSDRDDDEFGPAAEDGDSLSVNDRTLQGIVLSCGEFGHGNKLSVSARQLRIVSSMDDSVATLAERPLIRLSTREPYEHVEQPGKGIAVRLPPGGLVSALDPTLRRTHGVWVAWGSGSADRQVADSHGRVPVPPPPEVAEYTLRRVWLDAADVEGYYLGFANSVLWPLCHLLIHHLRFRDEDWARYQSVNQRFADAALEEAARLKAETGQEPIAWIQDYHLALVADSLRAARPELFIHQFLHVPFPPPEIFRLLPFGVCQALLRGLLGNDLLAFHTERYAVNFVDCAAQLLPGAVGDRAALTVRYADRTTALGVFPISIDVNRFEAMA